MWLIFLSPAGLQVDVDEAFGERRKTVSPAADKTTKAPIIASHFFVISISTPP
jgi:hypothetical protein